MAAMDESEALRRSQLGLPANESGLIADAIDSDADEVFLDLEDSLAPGEKEQARSELINIVEGHDWSETVLSYRINGTETRWWYDDVIDVLEAVGSDIDNLIVPKIDHPSEVRTVSTLIRSIETSISLSIGSIGLGVQIETAAAMNNVTDIVDADDRLAAVIFGPADYATSIGAAHGQSDYPGHYWHYPLSRVAHAAASAGVLAVAGPYTDTDDSQGFQQACDYERALGYDGKVLIHPDQIEAVNQMFSPNIAEAKRAQEVVHQYETTDRDAVAAIDGKVIDREMYAMAKRIVSRAERAGLL